MAMTWLFGRGHEHDAAVDDRRRLMHPGFASREHPHRTQARDVGRRDLRERTESPAVVRPADHQPVPVFGILQSLGGDRLVVAEQRRQRRGNRRGSALCGRRREYGADDHGPQVPHRGSCAGVARRQGYIRAKALRVAEFNQIRENVPMRLMLALGVVTMAACSSTSEPPKPALTYPATTMGSVVDDFGGTKVADPYRWMESLDSPEVKAWITAQNAVTDPYLNALPHRKALNERLTALWNYPRVGLPSLEGGQMFYAKNAGLQRQAPIFRRDGIDKPPTLVIDPNVISEEGTRLARGIQSVARCEAHGLRLV